MSTIQLRIDEETKRKAKKTLDKLGIDMSAAIKLYLRQIVIKKGIPFELLTENKLTPQQEKAVNKASEDAKLSINISEEMDIKEAVDYLNEL